LAASPASLPLSESAVLPLDDDALPLVLALLPVALGVPLLPPLPLFGFGSAFSVDSMPLSLAAAIERDLPLPDGAGELGPATIPLRNSTSCVPIRMALETMKYTLRIAATLR